MTQQVVWVGATAISTLSWAYDEAGNQTAAFDADGNETTSVYDGGQLVRQEVGSLDHETFGYDLNGNQTPHIDINGYTTNSTYDDDMLATQVVNSTDIRSGYNLAWVCTRLKNHPGALEMLFGATAYVIRGCAFHVTESKT